MVEIIDTGVVVPDWVKYWNKFDGTVWNLAGNNLFMNVVISKGQRWSKL